jgi:Tol biopolymer transport system component
MDGFHGKPKFTLHPMKAHLSCLLALLVTQGCDSATAPAPIPLPLTDRIVFQSDRADPLGDIYAMNFDGSDLRRLTISSLSETCPSVSPDGNWIAYYSHVGDPANSPQVYGLELMRANGTDHLNLAPAIDPPYGCPVWSRTSDAIEVTTFDVPSKSSDASSEQTRIFDLTGQQLAAFANWSYSIASFSAAGTELLGAASACGRNGCTLPEVNVEKRDGTGWRWLTGTTTATGTFQRDGGGYPNLSPDGATVVYACNDPANPGLNALCTVKWDGTAKTFLAHQWVRNPRFSPDGLRIAAECGTTPQYFGGKLCVTDLAGTSVSSWPVNMSSFAPAWTPDGTRLVLECGVTDIFTIKDICTVQSDGSALTNLTQGQGTNKNPSVTKTP